MVPIGFIRTPFPDKFGIPRQGSLLPESQGVVELDSSSLSRESLDGLEPGQNIWLLFLFHQSPALTKAKVRPPRLEGQSLGVFATRSPHRPNPVGMTLCTLDKIDSNKLQLFVRGIDLVDGTPLIDIKPYLPYADQPKEPGPSFPPPEPSLYVEISPPAQKQLQDFQCDSHTLEMVKKRMAWDPRPNSQKSHKQEFFIRQGPWDFQFQVQEKKATLISLRKTNL